MSFLENRWIVFFDTEFANTEPDKNGHRYLISIGCVSMCGREFYAEITDTWDDHLCSMFTLNTVLPLLQGGEYRMGVSELAVRLKAWIESLTDKEVVFHSDAPTFDWPFIKEIFDYNGWPKNLHRECAPVCFEEYKQRHAYNSAQANYWKDYGARQHHALVDARSLLFAWKYAMKCWHTD